MKHRKVKHTNEYNGHTVPRRQPDIEEKEKTQMGDRRKIGEQNDNRNK